MPGVRRTLEAYSRYFEQTVEVVEPEDERALRRVLREAWVQRRTVTFRAGGCAFDRQSLNAGLVVSLRRLDHIEVDPAVPAVRVGPGATWGAIVAELLPRGLVPAVTVTTSRATAGGTLSANALSRFSSAYGKEGGWVIEARIMTAQGTMYVCRPPLPQLPATQWSPEERLFMGAVGGLGYLGAFVEITYAVLEVDTPVRVRTDVQSFHDLRTFSAALTTAVNAAEAEASDPRNPGMRDAVYGTLYTDGEPTREAMLFMSSYTTEPLHRMLPHRPRHLLRPFVELGLATRLNHYVWSKGFRKLPDGSPYVDPADDFAFLMDGNVRSMRLWRFLRIVQQTYVVRRPSLEAWLEMAATQFDEHGLRPTLQDVVALPKDRPFCLTVNPHGPVFAITYTFIARTRAAIEDDVAPAFRKLATIADEDFDGRVSLVKNVFADHATVQHMFGPQVGDFAALREEFGAERILANAFYHDTLGRGPGAEGTRPAPGG